MFETVSLLVPLAGLAILVLFLVAAPGSWYLAFKTIHVLAAIVWLGGGAALTTYGIRSLRKKNNAQELGVIAAEAEFLGTRVFTPASFLLLAMGIAMMINGDLDWGQFWVVGGLVGWGITTATGILLLSPEAKRLSTLIPERGIEDAEVQARIRKVLHIARADVTVILLIAALMVAKPFS